MEAASLRLAVVSTPRSGNTWLRHMLAEALDLYSLSAHLPSQVSWNALPARAIVQMHWCPDDEFRGLLRQHGFRPIVLARHPLDVLISTLVFAQHDNSTFEWLGGADGDERSLEGMTPPSGEFLHYAIGPRAAAILNVSAAWWLQSDAYRVRYEDLAADTVGQLTGIVSALSASARKDIDQVVANSTPEAMRRLSIGMRFHVWHARPGLWRSLLTAKVARQIGDAHQGVMDSLGYVCDPDESLTQEQAWQSWHRLDGAALKRTIHGVKTSMIDVESQLNDAIVQQRDDVKAIAKRIADLERLPADVERQLGLLQQHQTLIEQQQALLERQHAELESLSRQFADQPWPQIRELAGLGPWSIVPARTLHRWSQRFPRCSAVFKAVVRSCRRAIRRPGTASDK